MHLDEGSDVIDMPEGRRQRKKPAWMKDYFLSTCRSRMAKTKNTPRKHPICPSCKETVPSSETFESHLVKCAKSRKQCDMCPANFKREAYLVRHKKDKHDVSSSRVAAADLDGPSCSRQETQQREQSEDSSSSSSESSADGSWDVDPEIEVGESHKALVAEDADDGDYAHGSLLLGRLFRKPTRSGPVVAGSKRKAPEVDRQDNVKQVCVQSRCVERDVQVSSAVKSSGEKGVQVSLTGKVCSEEKGVQVFPEVVDNATQVEDQEPDRKNRCESCGVAFDDMAMFFIHKGCHTSGDEYKCNVCGEDCRDKMSFFIHVTMGHRQQ